MLLTEIDNPNARSSSGGRFKDESLIPILISKRTEQFRTKGGLEGIQSPTIRSQGRLQFDPRTVELALLNPRAPMNPEAGAGGETIAKAINKVLTEGRTSIVSRDPRGLKPTGKPNEFVDPSDPCLLYTSPSPRDQRGSRMPSSA